MDYTVFLKILLYVISHQWQWFDSGWPGLILVFYFVFYGFVVYNPLADIMWKYDGIYSWQLETNIGMFHPWFSTTPLLYWKVPRIIAWTCNCKPISVTCVTVCLNVSILRLVINFLFSRWHFWETWATTIIILVAFDKHLDFPDHPMNCKCLCLNPGDHVHSKSPPKRSGDIPWVSFGIPRSAVPMRSRLPLEALQGGTWSCHVLSAAFSEISCAVQLMFLVLVAARSMPGLVCQVWGEIGGNMMRCPSTVVTKAKQFFL